MTHVIITGGSSGIGLAIGHIYAARGARISLIARTAATLDAARTAITAREGIDAAMIAVASADVAQEAQIRAAMHACEARFGPCDILVTAAGIVHPGPFDTLSSADFDQQMATNFQGSVYAVRAVYDSMCDRGSGRIMLVSSGAGLIGIYGYAAYCASKFALHGFAEALRSEARPRGVRVSVCFPPDTQTPQFDGEIALRPPEAAIIMGAVRPWSAETVANNIVRAIDRGRFDVFFGLSLHALGRFGSTLKPFLNWWFDRAIRSVRSIRR
ncbi:SDR family oxidoreductase [Pararhizobium antarcticum]|uniref:3-dehydrosphinganine reductase n=1 Tax=Pararhizobium antarcticum TaxID=1798805 RepID=A0A657LZ28_9HYPH|nr:SDR family oxidoreductase [Pararhizobium antarcticum]OJF98448.1 translocation protein [Rhizobium sp. 58]OJG01020.1 translocation protein [Pararhizobium antarcticum]